MNCGVLEPSYPTTARFPPSSTSVLVVRAQLGACGVVGGHRETGLGAERVQGSPGLSQPDVTTLWLDATSFPVLHHESCG